MEERRGFIHEKLEVKLLILFILRRLPAEIDGERLADLVLIDGGISYFDYKDCLAELVNAAQVQETEFGYQVTAKGSINGETLESLVPYSVRTKAEKVIKPVAEEMRRSAQILANHEPDGEGGMTVYLAIKDGIGSIIDLKLIAADEAQAIRMEKRFRRDAEGIYNRLMQDLCEE